MVMEKYNKEWIKKENVASGMFGLHGNNTVFPRLSQLSHILYIVALFSCKVHTHKGKIARSGSHRMSQHCPFLDPRPLPALQFFPLLTRTLTLLALPSFVVCPHFLCLSETFVTEWGDPGSLPMNLCCPLTCIATKLLKVKRKERRVWGSD